MRFGDVPTVSPARMHPHANLYLDTPRPLPSRAARGACGELVDAGEAEAAWSGVLRTVRAGMLAGPSRVSQRLPGFTYVGARNSPRSQPAVSRDFIGSTSAITH